MRTEMSFSVLSGLLAVVGGLLIGTWLLGRQEDVGWAAGVALGMAIAAAVSGTIGVWLHTRHHQVVGLILSFLSAIFLIGLSFSLLASLSIVLLPAALLAAIAGLIGVLRELSEHWTMSR